VAGPPADLISVAFTTHDQAEVALGAALALDPKDAAVVVRGADGRIQLHQTHQTSIGEGAIVGGTAGLLAGLLVGLPVAGALAGLVGGGGFGARDTGIPDEQLRALGKSLDADQAVLCVLVEPDGASALTAALEPFGGELLP
jgi:uncharacterized membrane protein